MKNPLQEPIWFTPPDGSSKSLWKDSPDPPKAPDPYATAAAQTDQNEQTARTNARLNRVNSTTPFGSTTYTEQPGDRWTSQVNLDPRLQSGLDSSLSQIGGNLSNPFSLGSLPAAPSLSDENRQQLSEQMLSRLEPQFARDDEALRTRLANQGIKAGSAAYGTEMDKANQAKTDARVQADIASGDQQAQLFGLGTQARQNALSEQQQVRQQPINELNSLLTGSQLQQPAQTNVAGTDISGNIYQNYTGQQDAYNQKVATNNANTGGAASLAMAAAIYF